ncbi:MAG: 4Fe-4S binding protein [Coriobacteriales bacterium]|jgi:ferredoxin-type protein NapH|nr:4Fe-4S binding protein [Coriobacteriales bacterium]
MKKLNILQIIIPVAIALLFTGAYIAHLDFGMLSSFGWSTISMICPLGALMALLAAKMLVPRAVIALVVAIVLMVIFGRAFCAWVCPVPVMQKFRDLVARITKEGITSGSSSKKALNDSTDVTDAVDASADVAVAADVAVDADVDADVASDKVVAVQETVDETLAVKGAGELQAGAYSSCAKKRGAAIDSRHIILGGSVLTALVFGFPVFCLICPIGLTFASIFLVVNLFGSGDVTWTVVVVPLLLVVEIVFFRKWCSRFCPLSAFMSLSGKLGRFFRPKINDTTCRETTTGEACGICGNVCPVMIDPRHPDVSPAAISECTRCLACAKSCPTQSIKIPIWSSKDELLQKTTPLPPEDKQ